MRDIHVVLFFGAGALVLFSFVYFFFDRMRRSGGDGNGSPRPRSFSITFARLFGLITVGILGVGLSFSGGDAALAEAGFTLLGTIAGYLAGARTRTTQGAPPPPDGGKGEPPIATNELS